jgi:hypothetical protein
MTMLALTETPAPIIGISPAQRIALVECHIAGILKKFHGSWGADGTLARIAGVTVADLARDGMLVVNSTTYRKDTARLSERGAWFARTLAAVKIAP